RSLRRTARRAFGGEADPVPRARGRRYPHRCRWRRARRGGGRPCSCPRRCCRSPRARTSASPGDPHRTDGPGRPRTSRYSCRRRLRLHGCLSRHVPAGSRPRCSLTQLGGDELALFRDGLPALVDLVELGLEALVLLTEASDRLDIVVGTGDGEGIGDLVHLALELRDLALDLAQALLDIGRRAPARLALGC